MRLQLLTLPGRRLPTQQQSQTLRQTGIKNPMAMATAKTTTLLPLNTFGFRVTSKRNSQTLPLARAKQSLSSPRRRHSRRHCSSCLQQKRQPAGQAQLQLLLGGLLLAAHIAGGAAVGYSYARFEGPVAGPEHQVHVPDAYSADGTRADYVARPEYSFAYGVEDGKTRVLQNRKETRHGDEVRGVYSVVDPDGTLRVVKYTANDVDGFQAEVITNGVTTLHGHGQEQRPQQDSGEGQLKEKDKAQYQYEVHENVSEDEDGAAEGADDDDEEAEEYQGSSEEGYEDAADAHSQRQQAEDASGSASSEDY